MVIIHNADGSQIGVANGISAGPVVVNGIPDNCMYEIRNSSQQVAVITSHPNMWIEIQPA